VHRTEKERVVEELRQRLEATESLIVADYRGLTNAELAGVRAKLREHGATFAVVKNTLTRRAAEAAGAESLLALLEGPTAIAFVEAEGDPVAVAKALADTAKDTKILSLRGGILSGTTMEAADVEALAKLPPEDVLKSQLVGVIVAPVTQLLGLLDAPLRDLVGLIDARVEQLGGQAADEPAEPAEPAEVADEAPAEAPAEPAEPAEVADEAPAEAPAEASAAEPPVAGDAEAAGEGPVAEASDETQETQETQETEQTEQTQEEQE
jgi:large subunit ribosomal protein L10